MLKRITLAPLYVPYFLGGWGIQLLTGAGSHDPNIAAAFAKPPPAPNTSTFLPLSTHSWSVQGNTWQSQPPTFAPTAAQSTLPNSLKIVTLNVQKNDSWMIDFVASTQERWEYQLSTLIPNEKADLICLNEVDGAFLNLALAQAWLRNDYYSTHIDPSTFPYRGNVIFIKKQTFHINTTYLEQLGRGRACVVTSLTPLAHPDEILVVCSAHFTAHAKYHQQRRAELCNLTHGLETLNFHPNNPTAASASPKASILILGDFNFHSEVENASIPSNYSDLWQSLFVYCFPNHN